MNDTKLDFEKRKSEVDNYLSLLIILDDENTRVKYKKDNIVVEEKISDQLQKVLIANGFLLLYNLIEATVRNSILEIYFKVQDNSLAFEKLSENLKKIWIKQSTGSLKEGNFRQDTLRKQVLDIAEFIVKKETISLSKDNLDFSGNLDARKIRELAYSFGFDAPAKGQSLVTIKNKRNHLAHGDFTFSDIGKDFTVGELNDFKTEIFDYLSDVINKIEDFIIQKKYTVSTGTP